MESKFEKIQGKTIIIAEDIEKCLTEKKIYIDDFHKKKIDVSRFIKLKSLAGQFNQIINLSKALSLESLMLWKYSKNSNDISYLTGLRELFLRQGGITDLSCIKPLKNLERIELSFLTKLTEISALKSLSFSLKVLEIENCKKIEHLESTLKELKEIEVLKIIGIDLKNIYFVKFLPKLKKLIIINSNIINGDIRPAQKIEYVLIDNKRHYNFKFDEDLMKIVPK